MTIRSFFESQLLEYETPKVVQIKSTPVGIIHRLIQVLVLSYVIIWVFVVENGYQHIDMGATSGTTIKVKGVSYINSTDERVGERIWDNTDLIVPPQQRDAFFVATNIITTHSQSQGICPEQFGVPYANCTSDTHCQPVGTAYHLGHGTSTGRCNRTTGTCEVRAWCPLEVDYPLPNDGESAIISEAKDFTAFIKSCVHFPYYKKRRCNLVETISKDDLRTCRYHPVKSPLCPIFRLGDIVSLAETDNNAEKMNDSYVEKMAVKGGVISIAITWDCNFDYNETKCIPEYSFTRLDNFDGNTIAMGYNLRHATESTESGTIRRQLYKSYGIQFVINVEAQARAFNFVSFTQNVGSGLALLGLATFCSGFIITTLHKKKSLYKKHIYHQITDNVTTPDTEKHREHFMSSPSYTSDWTYWEKKVPSASTNNRISLPY